MFHYYFHGDFTTKGFIKQRGVFFGFLTTFGVFAIFSFIDIKLFYQLSIFSALSLLIAYLLFSFVFGYLDIPKPIIKPKNIKKLRFNPLLVIIISAILFGYSYINLKFDTNLKNLDYKNEKLLKLSKIFNDSLRKENYQNIILNAKSKELLLQKYELLNNLYPNMLGIGNFILSKKKCQQRVENIKEYDFESVKKLIRQESKRVGFSDVFTDLYANINSVKCDMNPIDEIGFKIVKLKQRYYTLVLIDKRYKVTFDEAMEPLDITKNLLSDMQRAKNSISKSIFFSMLFIIFILFIISGVDILFPLAFVVFPLSIVLFFISLFGTINIMHLFGLIILMAISIDYGIYMYDTKSLVETTMAVKYALLSTLAGFGVLILSDCVALASIGFVISVGVGAIFILIYGKRYEDI
jgi:predicted exporter